MCPVKNQVTFYLLKPICACFASNKFGLRPVDYAQSEKMKSVLMLAVKNESFSLKQPSDEVSVADVVFFVCFILLFEKKHKLHSVSVEGLDLSTVCHLSVKITG